ncbi:AAA family ATPase [Winogradskyella immobilis]|uniref:AAA family ATPase n=1 Tax=Winogradskyella immobilis TaxID=2816852 RepID=UPI001D0C5D81|nr:ATP-binding protein [Winogradskyella immobilis]MCG0017653.1 ATP-binding protein [Winogradskyella immobilis]
MKPKKIVITGGPATGKTAIIDNLNAKGYVCFEEVIRKLTSEAQDSGDITEAHSNPIALVSDSEKFNTTLINLRVDDFKASENLKTDISFFDRGMPDVLAYMSYFNQPIGKTYKEICKTYIYDYVFILPPWKAIFTDDKERFETFEQATDIYHKLKETYKQFGYQIIEVPQESIEERTLFILAQLNL